MLKKLSILVLPLVLALSAMVMFGNVNMHAVAQQNQTSSQGQGNQTSSQGQGNQKIPLSLDEKLLNYTNNAIKASKGKNSKLLTSSLKNLQGALINATGKQAVFLPDTTTSGSGSGSGSSSSGSGSGSGSSSSGSGSGSGSSHSSTHHSTK